MYETSHDIVATATDRAREAGSAAFIPGNAEHALRDDADNVPKLFYVFPTDQFADVVYRFAREAAPKTSWAGRG